MRSGIKIRFVNKTTLPNGDTVWWFDSSLSIKEEDELRAFLQTKLKQPFHMEAVLPDPAGKVPNWVEIGTDDPQDACFLKLITQ